MPCLSGVYGRTGPFSALDNVIYEGIATVFQRESTGEWKVYGDYRQTADSMLQSWLLELKNMNLEEFQEVYREWKCYHPIYQERWIVYKVGVWMIDRFIKDRGLKVNELTRYSAEEFINLYGV